MQKRNVVLLGLLALGLCSQSTAETFEQWSKTEKEIDRSKSALEIKSADGDFSIGFNGYLQQNNVFSYSPGGNAPSKSDFDVELNAARIGFYGTAFHPSLTYFIQTDFSREMAPTAGGKGSSGYLRDYYLNWEAYKKIQLRIGKFGMPFARQSMVLGSHTQFYRPNIASAGFLLNNTGKDVGIMVHNGRNEQIEWAVAAVSNGLVARVGYNHNGIDGYELTDFNGGPLRFAVGLNGLAQIDYRSPNLDDLRAGMDFLVKVSHFSSNGAFFYKYKKEATAATHGVGAGVDFGYLMHDRYEPVLRYGFAKEGKFSGHEILAGFNYYIYGQHLKVQAYAGTEIAGGDIGKWLGGAQFQFAL